MKISVAGKGGSGKTTLSATLARLFARNGYTVLAIDGDPNPNLGTALGVQKNELTGLHPLPKSILARQSDESGASKVVGLSEPIEHITEEHGIPAPDGVTLLMTGKVDIAGDG